MNLNQNIQLVNQIGNAFSDLYYQTLGGAKDIKLLRSLYSNDAEIVWNSQPFGGPDEFCEFVLTIPEFSYKITAVGSQPVGEMGQFIGILLTTNGFVLGKGEMSAFTHTFRLIPDSTKGINAYSIKVDRFCIV